MSRSRLEKLPSVIGPDPLLLGILARLQCRYIKVKQLLYRTVGFHEVEAPRCPDYWHMKLIRLSALGTQEIFLVLISFRG